MTEGALKRTEAPSVAGLRAPHLHLRHLPRIAGRRGFFREPRGPHITDMSDIQPNYKVIADKPSGALRLFPREQYRGRHHADRYRGQVPAPGPRQYRRILRQHRERQRTGPDQCRYPDLHPGEPLQHEPRRIRKLLLHRREIDRLTVSVQREGLTIVPTKLFFNDKGLVKIEIALAKAKRSTTSARPRPSATGTRQGAAIARSRVVDSNRLTRGRGWWRKKQSKAKVELTSFAWWWAGCLGAAVHRPPWLPASSMTRPS